MEHKSKLQIRTNKTQEIFRILQHEESNNKNIERNQGARTRVSHKKTTHPSNLFFSFRNFELNLVVMSFGVWSLDTRLGFYRINKGGFDSTSISTSRSGSQIK